VYDVLAILEELGIPLNVHPEAPGYYHDRERLFGRHALAWAMMFPRLKIILEHLSDRVSLRLLDLPNVFATMTPQHLLTTGDDWFGPPFDPHLYCMPCVKREEDRHALLAACTTGPHRGKIMAGTDSAPHEMPRKVDCGCAGVFTAPIALQLYAQAFASYGMLDCLQAFLSDNARRIYGITPPARTVRLVREPFTIPDRYGDVVPMWAGRTIEWSIAGGSAS
jgi:dihydroorotase